MVLKHCKHSDTNSALCIGLTRENISFIYSVANAIDLDQGDNGRLSFEIDDDHFRVETDADDPNKAKIVVNQYVRDH